MKLELYKPYKTRSGHKAVINHSMDEKTVMAFHFKTSLSGGVNPVLVYHYIDNGKVYGHVYDDNDIIAEWHEPRKGEFWVNVFEDQVGNLHGTRNDADTSATGLPRLALKRVVWTEGDEQ